MIWKGQYEDFASPPLAILGGFGFHLGFFFGGNLGAKWCFHH